MTTSHPMSDPVIGLLHPGEMGSVVGAVLRELGHEVLWASAGRGDRTAERARLARLTDAGSVAELAERSDVVISVVPPHGAVDVASDVARSVAGRASVFVDANAVSPRTAHRIGELVTGAGASYVDGGIVGPPPRKEGTTRLYLSGQRASEIAGLFDGGALEARVLPGEPTAASAIKMTYAAWTKGTDALLLAILAVAAAHDVDGALVEEWGLSKPTLLDHRHRAGRTAGRKGWRWIAEMEEIASTFSSAGLPDGFHQAAAAVFRGVPRDDEAEQDEVTLQRAIAALRNTGD